MERSEISLQLSKKDQLLPRCMAIAGGIVLAIAFVFGALMDFYNDLATTEKSFSLLNGWLIIYFIGGFLLSVGLSEMSKLKERALVVYLEKLLIPDGWTIDKNVGTESMPDLPRKFNKGLNIEDPEPFFIAYRERSGYKERLSFRKWMYGQGRRKTKIYLFDISSSLSAQLPGWIQFVQQGDDLLNLNDVNLESVEFNKNVVVRSLSPKLAYEVLSPDLMLWYLEKTARPLVYIEKDQLFIMPFISRGVNIQNSAISIEITRAYQQLDRLRTKLDDLLT